MDRAAWRIQITSLLGLLAIALGICALVSLRPPPAVARPLETGVSYVEINDPLAFEHTKAAGAHFVHTWLRWSDVAPLHEPDNWDPGNPADPNYNWKFMDDWVRNAVQAGLTPLVQIYGVPPWAQGCEADNVQAITPCDPSPDKLAVFAQAAARRYSGSFEGLPRVRYWQGLNEPNLSLYFNPQFKNGKSVSPALSRKLLNAFYAAIKSVSPSNLVLSAGLSPIAVPRYSIGPLRFTRELLCMAGRRNPRPTKGSCEGGVHFDIFDIHPYTTGGPSHEGNVDDVELGDLDELQELLSAADRAGRIKGHFGHTPLWITEFSWDSKPPDPGGLPMKILTRWTALALYRAWSAGVDHFFWFSLRDDASSGAAFSETLQSGLYFRGETLAQDRPKEMLQAFRFPFVAYSREDGFFFWGRTPTSTAGSVMIQVQEGRRWRDASVAHADANGIFTGEVETFYGRHEHGMVRALYRGEEAVPFSLHPVKEFHQAPFGNPVPGE